MQPTPLFRPYSLILDIDESVGHLEGARRIDLRCWQERLRYCCSKQTFRVFADHLQTVLTERHGPVMLGSGDFHHLSYALIAKQRTENLRVVIFDNHPDNMRYPFGIHCGSWVSHTAALPHVSHVHVVGITSNDMNLRHAWEHRLTPLMKKKLTYWCINSNAGWLHQIGLGHALRTFDSPRDLMTAFTSAMRAEKQDTYLSIDKDVLHTDYVTTNWDQGLLSTNDLVDAIKLFHGHIVAADITGDISFYRHRHLLKRCLSAMDGQALEIASTELSLHQARQNLCTKVLLTALNQALRPS